MIKKRFRKRGSDFGSYRIVSSEDIEREAAWEYLKNISFTEIMTSVLCCVIFVVNVFGVVHITNWLSDRLHTDGNTLFVILQVAVIGGYILLVQRRGEREDELKRQLQSCYLKIEALEKQLGDSAKNGNGMKANEYTE